MCADTAYGIAVSILVPLQCSNVKAVQKINEAELQLGVGSKSSWHDQYKESAYVFIGESTKT